MEVYGAVSACGAAEIVGQDAGQDNPDHRQCYMNIMNRCSKYFLSNPSWYTYSGFCASPFPPTIPSNASGSALFSKSHGGQKGVVGVITYDLLHNGCQDQAREKIAVMFSNPFDFQKYANWYAVGIFDESRKCDEYLYNEMYKEANQSFVRSKAQGNALIYKGCQITIQATMSDAYQPVIKVELTETA